MKKATATVITVCVGSASAAAAAIVSYANPAHATAIIASIGIINTAVASVIQQFVTTDTTTTA